MSRCFPFPPPGYEKKARPDDTELLEKEKRREKKPKKEKRNKEKREGKENRERERSDGKHKEKKDRKEKRRDKRKEKEKDKDKDKDKASTSGENKVASQSDDCNEEKLYQKERGQDKDESIIIPHEKEQKQKQKQAVQLQNRNGGKPIQNSLVCQEKLDSKFVQELGRRIRDEEKMGAGSQLVERSTATTSTTATGTDLAEGREKNKDRRRVDSREMGVQEGIKDESIFSGRNAMVLQNFAGAVQNRVEGMEKNSRRMERKEKTKEKEGDDKRKDKGREKNSQATKDKVREKEKKKEEKVKAKSENKNTEQENKSKDSNKNDHMYTHSIETLYIPHDSDKNVAAAAAAAAKGHVRKRKDLETNGTLHDNDVRLNSKMPRPNSSHPSTENGGRKLELNNHQRGVVVVDNSKVERKLNGVIEEAHQSPSSAIIAQADDQIAEATSSAKQPHPDSKYLGQVLSVPQMGEKDCSDVVDDQDEWLLNSSKKLNVDSLRYNDKQPPRVVWAEALQIDSADLCALPYVIPY